MVIQQTKKQSDLEKRLKLLRQQIYGSSEKKVSQYISESEKSDTLNHRYTGTPISSDITYLYQDLLKIFILAGLALGIQIILFILLKNHVLNFNFF